MSFCHGGKTKVKNQGKKSRSGKEKQTRQPTQKSQILFLRFVRKKFIGT